MILIVSLHNKDTDDYYMVYHLRPLDETDRNSRETCIDLMEFNDDGTIKQVVITNEGVKANSLKK